MNLHYLRKLVTGTLGDIGSNRDGRPWDEFFDAEHNDKLAKQSAGLQHQKCWYRKDFVMLAFYEGYLHSEHVPRTYWGSKQHLVNALKSKGLPCGKKTDRSYSYGGVKGKQRECFLLTRDTVRRLHRSWLNDPAWVYPDA